jgi:CubicO group peptidase (beta-lactamase class C family)
LQLIEKKKCRLDDDIRIHLGYTVRNPHHKNKPLTIRHLLTHTSSLCDEGTYDSFLQSSYSDAPPPLSSILKNGGIYYTKKNWKKNPPGKEFYYSNLGFGTAATIIEKISKKRFDVFCRKHIFESLSMHASFNVDDFENVDDFAVLYSHYNKEDRTRDEHQDKQEFEPSKNAFRGIKPKRKNYHGWRPGYNAIIHSPQGGLHCSIVDLSKLMIALAGNGTFGKKRILAPHSVNLMRKVHWSGTLDNGLYRETGLGLHITKNLIEGEKLYGHSGRAYGFQGMMYFNPVKKYGIIIFMNGGDYYRDEKEPLEFHNIEKELFTLLHDAYINQK